MQKVIVEAGQTVYVDLTPEEEAEVAARVAAGAEEAQREAVRAAKVEKAKGKVIDKDPDLARALGWLE